MTSFKSIIYISLISFHTSHAFTHLIRRTSRPSSFASLSSTTPTNHRLLTTIPSISTMITSTSLFAKRLPKSVREKSKKRRSKNGRSGPGRGGRGGEGRGDGDEGGRGRGGRGGRGSGGGGRGRDRREETQSSYENDESSNNFFDDGFDDDPFGDFDDGGDGGSYSYDTNNYENDDNNDDYNNDNDQTTTTRTTMQQSSATSQHFFSKKSLSNPNFSIIESSTFNQLCDGASISQPSRIQALAWPTLLKGQNCIVADQTGSGKTLSYVIPLLQRMIDEYVKEGTGTGDYSTGKKNGSPRVLILAPTAELADQIKLVCDKTTASLVGGVPISTRVITATGSHSTNIRDQIRMLASQKVDVLISTPGRIATILRTKNSSLDLSRLLSIVLDEVDVLLIDETFGPQLRTIGAAAPVSACQFVFVTATLPDEIIESVKREFQNVEVIQGPGLHRIAPNLKEHLVDVSVPSSSNQDLDLCFELKSKELMKALRSNRCERTLIFCNTVEACRKVENLVKRSDRRGSLWSIGAYHNAMNPEGRRKNLSVFTEGHREKSDVYNVLVCTERAARGVDFDSSPVDHVILFDFPKDPAEYVRRVGRTARAGRVGSSTVFAYAWQLPIARKIMGSKLDSFTVAADNYGEEDGEYTQKERRQARRSSGEKDKMIRGNIKSGRMWK